MDQKTNKMVDGNSAFLIGFDVKLFIYLPAPISGGDHVKE
jgi:hypothetical protein